MKSVYVDGYAAKFAFVCACGQVNAVNDVNFGP